MAKNLRGLIGTLLVWSGPFALSALVAGAAFVFSKPWTNGIVVPMAISVSITCITAPFGSWLRRGTRWTTAAGFDRRDSRPLDRMNIRDLPKVFVLLFLGLQLGLVPVGAWWMAHRPPHGPLASDYRPGSLEFCFQFVAFLYFGIRTQLLLLGGVWLRTTWGRRKISTVLREHEGPHDPIVEQRNFARSLRAYGIGLAILIGCVVFIAGSLIYQLYIAPGHGHWKFN